MACKRFFLLGEAAATAKEIELPLDIEFTDLQEIVAAHFSIVEPKGTYLSFTILVCQESLC